MKKSVVISALVACVCACSAPRPENVIEWQTLGNEADSTGAYYVQRFTVVADQPYERIGVCQFKRPVRPISLRTLRSFSSVIVAVPTKPRATFTSASLPYVKETALKRPNFLMRARSLIRNMLTIISVWAQSNFKTIILK